MGFFSGIGDALGGLAGGAIGGLIGGPSGALAGFGIGNSLFGNSGANAATARSAEKQMEFQREQNQKAMDFSERMRDSSWQAGVKDMKAAGLNPMLAVSQGGASAPTGVTSAGSSYQAKPVATAEAVNSAVSAALSSIQAKQAKAQTENIEADTRVKNAQADNAAELFLGQAREATARGSGTASEAEKRIRQRDAGLWEAEVHRVKSQASQSAASAEQLRAANVAIKQMMDNPKLAPYAGVLQLILGRGR